MAGRRNTANAIRGPQSALTDFLASHNISAQQIHQDYQRRLREAQEQAQQAGQQAGQSANEDDENKENASGPDDEAPEERKKRKRKEEKAIMKIRQSKEFKRRKYEEKSKKRQRDSDDEGDGDYDDDAIARNMLYKKSQPLPGQFENCEVCEKRFTVTAYSKTGPDGGLLCTKCSKELGKEEKKQQPTKRGPQKGKRRQTESDRMMGDVKPGAKKLLEICVRKVAANIGDIEEFGDLPESLLDRLSQVLSQRRALDPRTLELFLQAESSKIAIYDAAKLETDDFEKIFSFMPELEDVILRNAGQMKDKILLYMLDHNPKIKNLDLRAANLITNDAWIRFFSAQGPKLLTFQTSDLDSSMDDIAISTLSTHCPNLNRLKLKKLWKTTPESITSLATLPNLRHLTLSISPETPAQTLNHLISTIGRPLLTLSLSSFHAADDTTLATIHETCTHLQKLRFTCNSLATDSAFSTLFSPSWPNPPLQTVDLSDTRDIDNQNPDGPDDVHIGLASAGFKALMSHSGSKLRKLNIKSCRHISHDALFEAFNPEKHIYPLLKDVDMSFVGAVDEVVVMAVFKTCPKLEKLAVFGCNGVKGNAVRIPGGVAVCGLMDASESVVVEGLLGEGVARWDV